MITAAMTDGPAGGVEWALERPPTEIHYPSPNPDIIVAYYAEAPPPAGRIRYRHDGNDPASPDVHYYRHIPEETTNAPTEKVRAPDWRRNDDTSETPRQLRGL